MAVRIALVLILGGPLAVAFLLPAPGSNPPDGVLRVDVRGVPCCMFRLTTGLPCPLCGLTRSFVSLAHGRVRDSFLFHPFGPFLFAIFAGGALWQFRPLRRGLEDVRADAVRASGPPRAAVLLALGAVLAAWTVKLAWIPRVYW
jgi:hypothetical protein